MHQYLTLSRQIDFYSKSEIKELKLVQNFWMFGKPINKQEFKFGFVVPNSTN